MTILLRVLSLLCVLLMAAHFLRFGETGYFMSLLMAAALPFIRAPLSRYLLMAVLALGGFIWADTLTSLVSLRMAMGADWLRLAIILGSVLFVNMLALLLLCLGTGARAFAPRGTVPDSFAADILHHRAGTAATAFALTAMFLVLSRELPSLAILLLDRFLPGWGGLEILLLAIYAAVLAVAMLRPKQAFALRPGIWAWFSRIFFLQLALGLLGMDLLLMTGKLHLPIPALILAGPLYRGGGLFMLILFLSTVLLVGPAWCSHLCYIGSWDLGQSLRAGKKSPKELPYSPFVLRFSVLILVLGAALAFRSFGVPGPTAAWWSAGFGILSLLAILILSTKRGWMVHCTAICPLGVAANLLGRISPWRMRMAQGCDGCMACSTRCRYLALTRRDVERRRPGLSCTLCGDCVSACRNGHMGYAFPGLSPDLARTAFIVLVVSLHALFLGVARM